MIDDDDTGRVLTLSGFRNGPVRSLTGIASLCITFSFSCCFRLLILAFSMRLELVNAAEFSFRFQLLGGLFKCLSIAFRNEIKDDLLYCSPVLLRNCDRLLSNYATPLVLAVQVLFVRSTLK